jgi:heme-degrading monooxygenase HmoA
MRTTTVIRSDLDLSSLTDPQDQADAFRDQLSKSQSVLDTFKTARGITSDNLVSHSWAGHGEQVTIVRSWPDLETAQAWVDLVLSGETHAGLAYPPDVISAQVDPE